MNRYKNDNAYHKTFEYNFDHKRSTTVEFDIVEDQSGRVAKNVTLISNWRINYPKNVEIRLSDNRDEYGFYGEGIGFFTNGDIQQIIRKIIRITQEDSTS